MLNKPCREVDILEKTIHIELNNINPFIRRSNLNHLKQGFCSGTRQIRHYQIQYIYKGCGVININGEQFAAKEGNLFFWGPEEMHCISVDKNTPLDVIGVQFDFTRNHENKIYPCYPPRPFSYEEINEIIIFKDFKGFPYYTAVQNISKAELLLLEIVQEYQTQKIFYQEKSSALFKAFLMMIARQTILTSESRSKNKIIVDKVIDYIHCNYYMDLNNNYIARHFKFHPNYISRLMNIYTGMPLNKYLLHVRLNKAVELLNTSDMTIGEIAIKVGFKNIHYFSQIFKKKLGYSPSKIKQNIII